MQLVFRLTALFVFVLAPLAIGCGGPGAPQSGSADPMPEEADAQLAPEAGPGEMPAETTAPAGEEGSAATEKPAGDPADEEGAAADAPAPEK